MARQHPSLRGWIRSHVEALDQADRRGRSAPLDLDGFTLVVNPGFFNFFFFRLLRFPLRTTENKQICRRSQVWDRV